MFKIHFLPSFFFFCFVLFFCSVSLLYLICKHLPSIRHRAKLHTLSCCIRLTMLWGWSTHHLYLPRSWGRRIGMSLSQGQCVVELGVAPSWPDSTAHVLLPLGPQFLCRLRSFQLLMAETQRYQQSSSWIQQFTSSHKVGQDHKPGTDYLENYILIFGCFLHKTIFLGGFLTA